MPKEQKGLTYKLAEAVLSSLGEDQFVVISGEYSDAYIGVENNKLIMYHRQPPSNEWKTSPFYKDEGVRELATFLDREHRKLGMYPIVIEKKKEVLSNA